MIGTFGALMFECSRRRVHTFSDLTVTNQSRWAQHDVHLEKPILEWIGPGLTEVGFKMNFNKEWGSDPFGSLMILRIYVNTGFFSPLLVGKKPIALGWNLWVVTDVSEEHKWFDRRGTLFGASVDVKLKEYRLII
jgi:phage protein U